MKIHLPKKPKDESRENLKRLYGKRSIESLGNVFGESVLQEQIKNHCNKYNDTYVIMMDWDDIYVTLEFRSI